MGCPLELSGEQEEGEQYPIASGHPAEVLADLANRDALAGLRVQGATLEDVFLNLTGREYRARSWPACPGRCSSGSSGIAPPSSSRSCCPFCSCCSSARSTSTPPC